MPIWPLSSMAGMCQTENTGFSRRWFDTHKTRMSGLPCGEGIVTPFRVVRSRPGYLHCCWPGDADACEENTITMLRCTSSTLSDPSLCVNGHVPGVGGRSRRHTTRLRQRSLDRPSCLPVTASVVGLERRRAADLRLTTLRPYVRHWLRIPQRIQFKVAVLTYKVLHGCAHHRTLVHSSVWPTYRVDELSAPPTLAASSSHSPTGPPLATEPFLLLVPRSGTVCHRRSHQRHHWTPFADVWRPVCSPCHIRTYNYRNWLTFVSGPWSKSLYI